MESVADFYDGKSVLITGPAGYVGEILLEALLRLCPGIKKVYGVLRDKKGVKAEERKEALLNKRVFEILREKSPEVLDKLEIVVGDISMPDFGMSEKDLNIVTQEVSIVFHVAACISFIKSQKYILMHNAISTHYAIQFCKKLKNIEALIFTSTAFANCNRKSEVKEKVYRLPYSADEFINEILNGTEDSISELISECQPAWPNNYTFSKCLAENILQDNASDFKVAIIRPSLIASVLKNPVYGYVEDSSGLTAFSIGVGKGVVRVLYGDPKSIMDLIPVDVVANAHIVAGYLVAKNRVESPFVVNCVSYGKAKPLKFGRYMEVMLEMVGRNPMPKRFQDPNFNTKICISRWQYLLISLYEHYIPAYVLDGFMKLSGKKPILVHLYKFFDKAMLTTYYFLTNVWAYETINFDKINTMISDEDKEVFYTNNLDLIDELEIAFSIPLSSPFYEWKIDKKSFVERKKIARRRSMLTGFIKRAAVICFILFMYMMFTFFFM